MEKIMNQINELEEQIFAREVLIKSVLDNEDYMILDGEIIDKKTFETVRKATEKELQWFYDIRLMQLHIKELKRTLPR